MNAVNGRFSRRLGEVIHNARSSRLRLGAFRVRRLGGRGAESPWVVAYRPRAISRKEGFRARRSKAQPWLAVRALALALTCPSEGKQHVAAVAATRLQYGLAGDHAPSRCSRGRAAGKPRCGGTMA